MKKALVATAATILAVAGCSGGGSSYDTARDLADRLGCTDYDEEPGAVAPADVATCDLKGDRVTLIVGENADERDATIEVAEKLSAAFGSEQSGGVATGANWAVMGDDRAVERAAEALDGDVR